MTPSTPLPIVEVPAGRTGPRAEAEAPASTPPSLTVSLEPGRRRRIPHSPMRLAIARNMSHSLAAAPQVTAVFDADFTAIARHRDAVKGRMKADGVKLSYTAYIVAACVAAMKVVPEVNSRWHDDALEVFDDIGIGIGKALGDKGLVAPVIRRAQDLSLRGFVARLQDLTSRGRANALKGADLKGGTFTISNHGVSDSLFTSPIIINQPQSAILSVGKLEKRVVVREVGGWTRSRCARCLCLADHRPPLARRPSDQRLAHGIHPHARDLAAMTASTDFDVLEIGAGPGGYACAIRAAPPGPGTACVDARETLGGTCLNVGCIPSKALLNASHHYALAASGGLTAFGIEIGRVSIDPAVMMRRKDETVSSLTKGIEFLFRKNGVTRLSGHARLAGGAG